MSTPVPRGTYLRIAGEIADQLRAAQERRELPSAAEVQRRYGVSRGVALRAFRALQEQGLAVPAPGGRWRVAWRDGADRRPLAVQMTEFIEVTGLGEGDAYPSEGQLCERFKVSRPTVRKALAELEAAGVLAPGGQGRPRTVLKQPKR